MNKDTFESFNEFCYRLNEDEKGVFGTIIDKTKSFLPRVLRFSRAKKVMKNYLKGFEKKSLSLIKHFEKNIKNISDTADKNFEKFKRDKLESLKAMDRLDLAVNLAVSYKKDVTSLKENEIKKINTMVEKILDSYTASMEKRIDSPGFIINVELSDKGKGNLKAKWIELSNIKKMEIDQKLLELVNNAGLDKLDEINAELDSFIEEYRYSYGQHALDFYISTVTELAPDKFEIEIFLRAPGKRYALSEKGILLANDPDKLEDISSSRLIKMSNLTFGSYTMRITASAEDYVRPYLKIAGTTKAKLGEIENLGELAKISKGASAPTPEPPRPINLPGWGEAF